MPYNNISIKNYEALNRWGFYFGYCKVPQWGNLWRNGSDGTHTRNRTSDITPDSKQFLTNYFYSFRDVLQSVNQDMFGFRTHLKRCWRGRSFQAFHSFFSESDMRETNVTTLLALPGRLWRVYVIFLMCFPKDAGEQWSDLQKQLCIHCEIKYMF